MSDQLAFPLNLVGACDNRMDMESTNDWQVNIRPNDFPPFEFDTRLGPGYHAEWQGLIIPTYFLLHATWMDQKRLFYSKAGSD